MVRRDFALPEDDVEFLDSRGWGWEAINDNGNQWVILHGFEIPPNYCVNKVTTAIQIISGYPMSQLDMAYFLPWLNRTDGIHIGQADQPMSIRGESFQRWSRHYEWKPGFHSLSTHILAIESWLEREFEIKTFQGANL